LPTANLCFGPPPAGDLFSPRASIARYSVTGLTAEETDAATTALAPVLDTAQTATSSLGVPVEGVIKVATTSFVPPLSPPPSGPPEATTTVVANPPPSPELGDGSGDALTVEDDNAWIVRAVPQYS
jgi:hypothetical protein